MINKFILALLIITTTLLAGLTVVKFMPIKVITPNVQPYKVLTPAVRVGENVTYIVDACKFRNASAIASRVFAGIIRYPSVTSMSNVKKGCGKTPISVPVPTFVEPGTYHLELNITYRINALRDENYTFVTEDFKVIEPKE